MAPERYIILFGESGVGKSSIVNMIAQCDIAKVSHNESGCTLQATPYYVALEERDGVIKEFVIYDTVGFNEDGDGAVENSNAIANLFSLLKSLQAGVSLLIFCMRGPRKNDTVHKNWRLFHEIICREKVPIILAITGLEDWEDGHMDKWWLKNRGEFEKDNIIPNDVACITAIRGIRLKSGGTHTTRSTSSRG